MNENPVYLGKVTKIIMGQSPSSDAYNTEKKGLPFLQGCAEFGDKYPAPVKYCSIPLKVAPKGAVLVSVRAPVGDINIADQDYIIGRGLAAISGTSINQDLLPYLLDFVKPQLRQVAQGSTFEAISFDDLDKCLLPDLGNEKEQSKIAEVLTTVDRAIAQTEALIAKHLRIKTGLMQDLLTRGIDEYGQLRDESTHKFKSTPLGMIPVEWEVKALGKIAEINSGVTLGRKLSGENTVELPYLRVANVQDGYLDLSEIKTVTIYASEISRFSLEKGDVLMNEGGDFDKLGRGTVWGGQISPCLHQNHVFRVRANRKELLPEFLATVSSSPYGKKFFVLSSKQSTNLASINSTQLKGFPIPCPQISEQERIIEILKKTDTSIQTHKTSLDKLNRTKQGLMQDLLSGGVSVTPLLEK